MRSCRFEIHHLRWIPLKIMGIARLNDFLTIIILIRLRSGVIASLLSLIESKRVLRICESPSDPQIYLVKYVIRGSSSIHGVILSGIWSCISLAVLVPCVYKVGGIRVFLLPFFIALDASLLVEETLQFRLHVGLHLPRMILRSILIDHTSVTTIEDPQGACVIVGFCIGLSLKTLRQFLPRHPLVVDHLVAFDVPPLDHWPMPQPLGVVCPRVTWIPLDPIPTLIVDRSAVLVSSIMISIIRSASPVPWINVLSRRLRHGWIVGGMS